MIPIDNFMTMEHHGHETLLNQNTVVICLDIQKLDQDIFN